MFVISGSKSWVARLGKGVVFYRNDGMRPEMAAIEPATRRETFSKLVCHILV